MASQSWSNSSGDRWRLWPALLLIIAPLLGLIGLQGYEALSRLPHAAIGQRLAAHSFKVIVTAQSLRSAMQDAERDQRGYLLTGRLDYLKPYHEAAASAPHLLAALIRLTSGDPEQQRQLPDLAGQIGLKLQELRNAAQDYRTGRLSSAQSLAQTVAGLHEMQSIEHTIDVLTTTQNALLSGRLATVATQDQALQRVAMISTMLASILMMSGLILAVRNFHRSRRLQQEISRHAEDVAQANHELAQRNDELARATTVAQEAREQARQAERAKGRFLATASHDLRQPLQAVSLLNGALRRSARDSAITDVLRQQDEAIGAMSRLLNALLDISKLESGAVKPEPADFAVSTLLETMGREFHSVAASKGLTLQIEPCEACAHSDPALVEQILRNLVSNAIKYTREGRVGVHATADPPWVNIDVIDSGVGIPQDQIHLLGEEFYQIGVSSSSAREGYGLGLSIVRRLVQLLGLQLDVRSQVGKGSTFSLRLPQGVSPPVAAQPQASAMLVHGGAAGSAQILLVEDDPDVRNATRMLLKAEGYGVAAASCSLEAEQRAREDGSIALVVTDFHLGAGETGVQVILRLREILHAPVKAVLITGDTSSAIRELPPDPNLRVLSKPVRAEAFLGLVRELLAA